MSNHMTSGSVIPAFGSLTASALSSIQHIYASMPSTREALGVLFAVDAAQRDTTEAWTIFFVETACSQLLWDVRPTGTLTDDDAAWVLERYDEAPSISGLAILVRLIEEAHRLPSAFSADVRLRASAFSAKMGMSPQRRPRSVPYLRLVA